MLQKLVLASQSPQRKSILRDLGLEYMADPPHIDEHHAGLKRPHAIAKSIALRKAEAIVKKHPGKWVLGCDTFVVLKNGEIAGKPKDRKEAKRVVKLYQGAHADVYSGLALINPAMNQEFLGFEKTRLHFRKFTEEELEAYLDSNEWKERSGSMTIEGKGGKWVTKMVGDYWNVVGLPTNLLKEFLNRAEHRIIGRRISLKGAYKEDAKLIYQMSTNSDGAKFWYGALVGEKKPNFKEFLEDWKPYYFDDTYLNTGRSFLIMLNERPIGQINYNGIDSNQKTVEIDAIIADKKNWNKGYGRESVRLLCKYLFKAFGLKTIWLETIKANPRAIKSYQKAGFKIADAYQKNGIEWVRLELSRAKRT